MVFGQAVPMPFMSAAAPDGTITLTFIIDNNTYTVNGVMTVMDVSPTVIEGRTMLPIRFVAEPLGAAVSWDEATSKVTVQLMDTKLELWIGQGNALINGKSTPIDPNNPNVRPITLNDRTMLPIRFVTENLGCDVGWDEAAQRVTVTKGIDGTAVIPAKQPEADADETDDGADDDGREPGAPIIDGDGPGDGTGGEPAPEIPSELDKSLQNDVVIRNKFPAVSSASISTGIAQINPDIFQHVQPGPGSAASSPDEVLKPANINDPGVRFLGTGYDAVLGDFATNSGFAGKSMLNVNELLKDGQISRRFIDESHTLYRAGDTALSYSQSRAEGYGVTGKAFFLQGGVKNSFSDNFISEYGRSFATITHMSRQYYLYINPDLKDFSKYISDNYRKDVADAITGKNGWTYDRLLAEYGTHMTRSLYTGGWVDYNLSAYNSSVLARSYSEEQSNAAFDLGVIKGGGDKNSSNEIINGVSNNRISASTRATPSFPGVGTSEAAFFKWDENMRKALTVCDFDENSLIFADEAAKDSGLVYYDGKSQPAPWGGVYSTGPARDYSNARVRYVANRSNIEMVTYCINGLLLYETTWDKVNSAANVLPDGNDRWQKIGPIGGKPVYVGGDAGKYLKSSPAYILYARFGLSNDPARPPITDIYLSNLSKRSFSYNRFQAKYNGDSNAKLYTVPLWEGRNTPHRCELEKSYADGNEVKHYGTDFNRGVRIGGKNYRFGGDIRLNYVTSTSTKTPPLQRLRIKYFMDDDKNKVHPLYSPMDYNQPLLPDFFSVGRSDSDPQARDTAEGYNSFSAPYPYLSLLIFGERTIEYSLIGD